VALILAPAFLLGLAHATRRDDEDEQAEEVR
jgi:hypothetical protein